MTQPSEGDFTRDIGAGVEKMVYPEGVTVRNAAHGLGSVLSYPLNNHQSSGRFAADRFLIFLSASVPPDLCPSVRVDSDILVIELVR